MRVCVRLQPGVESRGDGERCSRELELLIGEMYLPHKFGEPLRGRFCHLTCLRSLVGLKSPPNCWGPRIDIYSKQNSKALVSARNSYFRAQPITPTPPVFALPPALGSLATLRA